MILSDLAGGVAFLGLALVREPGALVAVGFVSALAESPFCGITLGPLLGGVVVAAVGHEVVFVANAASFVVSVGLVASVRVRFSEDRTLGDAEEYKGMRAGFRFPFRDRVLRVIAGAWVVVVLGADIAQVADRPLSAAFHAGAIGCSDCWSPCGGWARWSARSPLAGSPSEPSPGGSSGVWPSPGWRRSGRGPRRGSHPSWA